MIKICKTNPNYFQDPLAEESTGIYMEFDNGNTISIQWGTGNYGSYRFSDPKPETYSAEVLISHTGVDREGISSMIRDFPIDPMGWCDSDMVARLIFQTATTDFDELVEVYGKKESCEIED